MVRQSSPVLESPRLSPRSESYPPQSEDFFANINTCLCGFFDFFLQEDGGKKSNQKTAKSKAVEFKDLLQKNNVTEVYFNHNTNVNRIEYGSSIVYRDLTKDLVNFIKKEYKDDPNVIKALNQLPKIGNKIQDEKLIEIAYKLAKDGDRIKENTDFKCEIQLEKNVKDSLKQEILAMSSNKDNSDNLDQISREGSDFLISVTDLFFCCTRTRDSNPKTVINVPSSSQEDSPRAR